ncbi:hypothetical protein C8T65DRAFT_228436 [Cerioporus squamosus]|nr:hypothetical protein C8T65DRAFT_228436 [Cerioporus squamosus]
MYCVHPHCRGDVSKIAETWQVAFRHMLTLTTIRSNTTEPENDWNTHDNSTVRALFSTAYLYIEPASSPRAVTCPAGSATLPARIPFARKMWMVTSVLVSFTISKSNNASDCDIRVGITASGAGCCVSTPPKQVQGGGRTSRPRLAGQPLIIRVRVRQNRPCILWHFVREGQPATPRQGAGTCRTRRAHNESPRTQPPPIVFRFERVRTHTIGRGIGRGELASVVTASCKREGTERRPVDSRSVCAKGGMIPA